MKTPAADRAAALDLPMAGRSPRLQSDQRCACLVPELQRSRATWRRRPASSSVGPVREKGGRVAPAFASITPDDFH